MANVTVDASLEGAIYKSAVASLILWTADVRNASSGTISSTYGSPQTNAAALRVQLQSSRSGYQGICSRTYLFFDDLDTATGGGTITSATLKVYASAAQFAFHSILVEGTAWGDDGSTTTLSNSDYSELDFGNAYSNELSTWGSGYNTYTLTAGAINDMNSNNYLNTVLVEGEYDYDNTNPSIGTQISAGISFKNASNPHELILTYSAPGYGHDINGVDSADIVSVNGVAAADIASFNGVS